MADIKKSLSQTKHFCSYQCPKFLCILNMNSANAMPSIWNNNPLATPVVLLHALCRIASSHLYLSKLLNTFVQNAGTE